MKSHNRFSPLDQAGFTLIELMVGLTIGMLVSIVIMQVFSVFEAQKRVTTGSADAQTNSSIALFNIDRELRLAGYPLMPDLIKSPLKCTTLTVGGAAADINRLSPATIADGGAGVSDAITIRYGSTHMGGVPALITTANPVPSVASPVPARDVTVSSNLGCAAGDVMLVTLGTTCAISSVKALSAAGVSPQTVTFVDPTLAAPTAAATDVTAAVAVISANLACLGPTWNEITYAVNNGNLQRAGVDSVAGIVNIQAQYGISAAPSSNQVIQWVDATGGTWTAPSVADRNRIKAIRIAVVARNPKIEQTAVTAACSSTTLPAPTGLCAWEGSALSPAPTIDLNAADPDWLRYRYRVFETIVPLRNMIWARGTL